MSHFILNLPSPIGEAGFSPPNLTEMKSLELSSSTSVLEAKALGIDCRIEGDFTVKGRIRGTIYYDPDSSKRNLQVNILSRTYDAKIVLANRTGINGTLTINGTDCIYIDMGSLQSASRGAVALMSDHSVFYFGTGATAGHFVCTCKGQGRTLIVGEDCMFANEVVINPTDFHAVFDVKTGQVLNEKIGSSRPVVLAPHVWLGSRAMIMKGVSIGAGSIVAAGSVVTRNLPSQVVAAGNPAKVVRQDVSWTRQLHPSAKNVAEIQLKLTSLSSRQ